MSRKWNSMNEVEKSRVSELFDAQETADHLIAVSQAETEGGTKKLGFIDLVRYLGSGEQDMPADLAEAVANDPVMLSDMSRLLRNHSTAYIPRVAAASSGEVTSRRAQDIHIKLLGSRSQDDQVYLIVDVERKIHEPAQLIVMGHGKIEKLELPSPIDGRMQILLDFDDPIVEMLADRSTEVAVR